MSFCGDGASLLPPVGEDGHVNPCFAVSTSAFAMLAWAVLVSVPHIVILRRGGGPERREASQLWPWIVFGSVCGFLLPLSFLVALVQDADAPSTYDFVSHALLAVAWVIATVHASAHKALGKPTWPLLGLWFVSLAGALLEVMALAAADLSVSIHLAQLVMWVPRAATAAFGAISGAWLMLRSRRHAAYMVVSQDDLDEREATPTPHAPSANKAPTPREAAAAAAAAVPTDSPFTGFGSKLRRLLPFLWPKQHLHLQVQLFVCLFLVLSVRVVNLFVPILNKAIIDALAGEGGEVYFPLTEILIYVLLRLLQGGAAGSMGLLTNLRNLLYIRVSQYTNREVAVTTFSHLHTLSLRYHLQRKTGEVLRVIDRGTASITALLETLVFSILPTILDIGIAIAYFVVAFDIYFGLIVFTAMTGYLVATVVITNWRTRFRRATVELDNEARQKAVDSLLNFETVKYYGAERIEVQRYSDAIMRWNEAEWMSQASLVLLNTAQNVLVTTGLLGGMLLAAHRVVQADLTVGDFSLFMSYIIQLYGPLNFLGTYYRTIQQNFIDMEKMLALLQENVEIRDAPDAKQLVVRRGEIEFDNVSFSYDGKTPSLRGISFSVRPGQTVAFVGTSGGGKTTIMRLLFRFYDVQSGAIRVDGQDIRTVTQASLRAAIGVVPQDTVLFNDTIRYNIAYGNMENATPEAIEEAARAAQIHDKILQFPEGYETKVGERGLRLSGGEKQRVAIARTLLKNPRIVLLDEATSALDTETERNIQSALNAMSQNRTTLVIAHRLSTIIHADEIIVLKQGTIVERGTHAQLLELQGEYYSLWTQQQEAQDGAAAAP